MKEEKLIITSSVTVGSETYTISFDLNTVDLLTERKARKCYEFLGPSIMWALRKEGKIINPLSFD